MPLNWLCYLFILGQNDRSAEQPSVLDAASQDRAHPDEDWPHVETRRHVLVMREVAADLGKFW
jgi:hypothetical protein